MMHILVLFRSAVITEEFLSIKIINFQTFGENVDIEQVLQNFLGVWITGKETS